MTLWIHLLGQPRLDIDTQPIKFSAPPKTLPLLAYLVLQRGKALERAQVAYTLWPDEPEPVARTNLRRHLHYLARALPSPPDSKPWVTSAERGICWNEQADYRLDVADFERFSVDPATLAKAVALYSGDLLETVYDDWVFFERERLRELYFSSLVSLIRQHRSRRDFQPAIGYSQQLLARDPLREDVLRQLLALRYESGDRAGALHEYERFAALLKTEMGITPMPETLTLYQTIVRNASLPTAVQSQSGDCIQEQPVARPRLEQDLPFVGRETEMEQASLRWSRALHGQGGLLLVSGEAGVGKTRLARELALLAEHQGARLMQGRSAPDEPRAYQAVIEALESALPLVTALSLPPLGLASLLTLLPEIAIRRKDLPRLSKAPEQQRDILFDTIALCLEKLAEPRPLLIILEDLQWAGESTLALVEYLARRAAEHPILLVGTYREEETPRSHPLRLLHRRLQRAALLDHLPLGRLSLQAVECLVAALPTPKQSSEDEDLARRVYTESEGNPLFVELLIRHWQELETARPAALPDRLHAYLSQRLAALPDNARAYAEVAAVSGLSFDAEVVREVGAWDEAQALDALSTLLDCRLLRETASRSLADYAFTHHLIQSTLYEQIPPGKRKRRHRRTAEVMLDLLPDSLEILSATLAGHFDRGEDAAQAIHWYQKAGVQASRLYANTEAVSYFSRALALAPAADSNLSYQILLHREQVFNRLGERQLQAEDLAALQALAEKLEADSTATSMQAEIALLRARLAEVTGDSPAALELAGQAVKLAQGPAQQAAGWVRLGTVLRRLEGQLDAAREKMERALTLTSQAHLPELQADIYIGLGAVCQEQGDYSEALSYYHSARQIFHTESNLVGEAHCLMNAGLVGVLRGEFDQAAANFHQALDTYRQVGYRQGEGWCLNNLGMLAYFQGNLAAAAEGYTQALHLCHSLGNQLDEASLLFNLGLLDMELGKYEHGRRSIEHALEVICSLGNRLNQGCFLSGLGLLLYHAGHLTEALTCSQQALEIAQEVNDRSTEAEAWNHLGHVHLALGRPAQAAQAYTQALEIRQELGQEQFALDSIAGLARVALAGGDLSQALANVEGLYTPILDADQPGAGGTAEFINAFEGAEEAYLIYLTCYQVLAAAEDPRSRLVAAQANDLLHQAAARITAPEEQRSFLENVPVNRALLSAHQCEELALQSFQ